MDRPVILARTSALIDAEVNSKVTLSVATGTDGWVVEVIETRVGGVVTDGLVGAPCVVARGDVGWGVAGSGDVGPGAVAPVGATLPPQPATRSSTTSVGGASFNRAH